MIKSGLGIPGQAQSRAELSPPVPQENGASKNAALSSSKDPELRKPGAFASAHDILTRVQYRPFQESAQRMLEARDHILASRTEPAQQDTSTQIGDLAVLPNKGTAYFVSDLEGRVDAVASLLEKEKILQRWRANDPEDQVFLCVLGDSVDRSSNSSVLMEFLLELKCHEGFSRNIVILAGNHELRMDIQSEPARDGSQNRMGFRQEVLSARWSYSRMDVASPPVKAVSALAEEPRFSEFKPYTYSFDDTWDGTASVPQQGGAPQQSVEDQKDAARLGMWLLFNDIFQALPKSIVSGNGLFATHGGFPTKGSFEDVFKAEEAPLTEGKKVHLQGALTNLTDVSPNRESCHPKNDLLDDLVWSDIDPRLDHSENRSLLGQNARGGAGRAGPGVAWGEGALKRFCEITGSTLCVRGHQARAPSHPDVKKLTKDIWQYGSAVTVTSSRVGAFVSLDLALPNPTPDNLARDTAIPDPTFG